MNHLPLDKLVNISQIDICTIHSYINCDACTADMQTQHQKWRLLHEAPNMMTLWHENIFCVTGPLWGNHQSPVYSLHKNGQWHRALIFLSCTPEEMVEQKVQLPVTWDAKDFIWSHCNDCHRFTYYSGQHINIIKIWFILDKFEYSGNYYINIVSRHLYVKWQFCRVSCPLLLTLRTKEKIYW